MINLSDYKNIHCIGIGGVGVSAIAEILLSRGYNVSGSDMKQSDLTDRLAADGVKIYIGHHAENVEEADLIIYSAAIAEENPEVIRAREKNIPLASRAEVLGVLMDDFKNSIAISGTHGKTTTTSMVSLILENAKLDPTILVGGNLAEIGGNVKVGSGDFFVTEACEYRDSFLELRPRIEVILNIDSDHLDYFEDIHHIVRSFDQFAKAVPEDGIIIAYDANPFVSQVIKDIPGAITYGYNENCTYHIADVIFDENGMPEFNVYYQGENLGRVYLSMPGEHNILNAVGAFACCHQLGVDPQSIIDTLDKFKGTQRRFDIQGTTEDGVKIVDDYAHHPTEVSVTVDTARKRFPDKKLVAIFKPHRASRVLYFAEQFAAALRKADVVYLCDFTSIDDKQDGTDIDITYLSKMIDGSFILSEDDEGAKILAKEEPCVYLFMSSKDIYELAEKVKRFQNY